jgi:hypothetical protein
VNVKKHYFSRPADSSVLRSEINFIRVILDHPCFSAPLSFIFNISKFLIVQSKNQNSLMM